MRCPDCEDEIESNSDKLAMAHYGMCFPCYRMNLVDYKSHPEDLEATISGIMNPFPHSEKNRKKVSGYEST